LLDFKPEHPGFPLFQKPKIAKQIEIKKWAPRRRFKPEEQVKEPIFYIFEIKHNSFMNFLSKFVSFLK